MLIALEGLDNSGKTTVLNELKRKLSSDDFTFCGEFLSPIAAETKSLLTNNSSYFLKTFFFASDRAWTYKNIAIPAFENYKIVIWDRYVDSALAYRRAEISEENIIDYTFVEKINAPFKKADATLYFNIPVSLSLERAQLSSEKEPYSGEVLRRVKKFYDEKLKVDNSYHCIDARKPLCNVIESTLSIINEIRTKGTKG
jgi:dTMP kinase